MTTFVYSNFILCQLMRMSVWLILFVITYILCVRQLMCIIDYILWQLLFMCENFYFYDNLYINYTSSNLCVNLDLTLLK